MHTPASSTQHHPAAPAAIAINSAQVPAPSKRKRINYDRRPRCPRKSTSAAAWCRYYARCAAQYARMVEVFTESGLHPHALKYSATERDRFLEGVRLIEAGQHPNQIAGMWK